MIIIPYQQQIGSDETGVLHAHNVAHPHVHPFLRLQTRVAHDKRYPAVHLVVVAMPLLPIKFIC